MELWLWKTKESPINLSEEAARGVNIPLLLLSFLLEPTVQGSSADAAQGSWEHRVSVVSKGKEANANHRE